MTSTTTTMTTKNKKNIKWNHRKASREPERVKMKMRKRKTVYEWKVFSWITLLRDWKIKTLSGVPARRIHVARTVTCRWTHATSETNEKRKTRLQEGQNKNVPHVLHGGVEGEEPWFLNWYCVFVCDASGANGRKRCDDKRNKIYDCALAIVTDRPRTSHIAHMNYHPLVINVSCLIWLASPAELQANVAQIYL